MHHLKKNKTKKRPLLKLGVNHLTFKGGWLIWNEISSTHTCTGARLLTCTNKHHARDQYKKFTKPIKSMLQREKHVVHAHVLRKIASA